MINYKKFLQMIIDIKNQVTEANKTAPKTIGVFGWTGIGKSTTINRLMGSEIVINEQNELEVKSGDKEFVKTSHNGSISCTLYPQLVTDGPGGYAFFDTAGVLDTREEGKETESAIAACSLPILLQNSTLHTVCVVLSNKFMEREGKLTFDEFFNKIRKLINLDHPAIQRKIFFVLTKTIHPSEMNGLHAALAQLPDQHKHIILTQLKNTLTNSENAARTKLKERVQALHLEKFIDTRPRYGNVFVVRWDKEDDTTNLLERLTSCSLKKSSERPRKENIDQLTFTSRAAYVRWQTKLYYVNKFEGTCTPIKLADKDIQAFDKEAKVDQLSNDSSKSLSEEQLQKITEIIGHSHIKSIMDPIPKDAFPLATPITLESAFTNLRARVEAIAIDINLAQHNVMNEFKAALINLIQGFNWLTAKAIHLPNIEDLTGKNIQIAFLDLIAFYAKNDVRDFPQSLKDLTTCLNEFPALIKEQCEEADEICGFLEHIGTNLNNIFQLPDISAQMEKDVQVTNINNGLDRFDSIDQTHTDALKSIFNQYATNNNDELYWNHVLRSCSDVSTLVDNENDYQSLISKRVQVIQDTKIANVKAILANSHLELGMALNNADNFFDAFSQALDDKTLNISQAEDELPPKWLRLRCADYIKNLHKKQPDPNWIKTAIEEVGGDDYEACLSHIEYTQEEIDNLKKENKATKPISGRPFIEGRMLCEIVSQALEKNISLHIAEVREVNNQLQTRHWQINKESHKPIRENEVDYNNANQLHLLDYNSSYLPLLSQIPTVSLLNVNSQQFVQQIGRDNSLRETFTKLAAFSHDSTDDAVIGMLADTLYAIHTRYMAAFYQPLPVPVYPLANNLPLVFRAVQALIEAGEKRDNLDTDPHAVIFNQVKQYVENLAQKITALVDGSTSILQRLLTDYYQSLETIRTAQNDYIQSYQRQSAQNVNILAGPATFIAGYQNGNVAATLNVAGGGILNPFLNGRVDATLLAAEALGLSSFTLGQPTTATGVQNLALERKNFESLLTHKINETNMAGGCLPGNALFSNENAEWERRVVVKMFNKDAYNTRVHKIYEHFLVKAKFILGWYDRRVVDYDGKAATAPGQLLIDFGAYNKRRNPPWIAYMSYTSGEADSHLYTCQNPNYTTETATLENEIRQAITDYVDIQVTRTARAMSWSFNTNIALSNADSEVTLADATVIQDARTAIDNWFLEHRRTIINSLKINTADAQNTTAQPHLDKRNTALINLDIQVALIKLFAKLLGKNSNDPFLANLVTAHRIELDIANITTLTVTDLSPSLTNALNGTRSTAKNIQDLNDDFKTHYLHPRTLVELLNSKLQLHTIWRDIKSSLPLLEPPLPNNNIKIVDYIRSMPKNSSKIAIAHCDLSSATVQACLTIALRDRASHLQEVMLRNTKLANIGSLLQMCNSVEILDLSYNPLSALAFTDLSLFLARNPELKSLDLSANPLESPIEISLDSALNLLASLYLNRNLTSLKLGCINCSEPIVIKAINYILHFKTINRDSANTVKVEDYFALLDTQLNNFLAANKHPVKEFDEENKLFREGSPDGALLRKRIKALQDGLNFSAIPKQHPKRATTQQRPANTIKPTINQAFFSSTPKFRVLHNLEAQTGWNCFDVAVGIQRAALVTYARANANNVEFRQLLAPEIRHAAAIAVTIMNDPSMPGDSYALPTSMRTSQLQEIVNRYQQANEDRRLLQAYIHCCDAIGRPEGNRPNLSELLAFFDTDINRATFADAYQPFLQVYNEVVLTNEQAFNTYANDINTYNQYINDYYARKEWVAFQSDGSTGMIDIAARMLDRVIIVHTPDFKRQGGWREIYKTKNVSANPEPINIQYSHLHFTALELNPRYTVQQGSTTVSNNHANNKH